MSECIGMKLRDIINVEPYVKILQRLGMGAVSSV